MPLMSPALRSHISDHYRTKGKFLAELHEEFGFNFDPCPFRSVFDGTAISWRGKRVFCNPPYGRGIPPFLAKAVEADIAVFLVPARTDTKWFHEIVLPKAKEVRFLRGRSYFEDGKRAPFPVMLIVFENAGVGAQGGKASQ